MTNDIFNTKLKKRLISTKEELNEVYSNVFFSKDFGTPECAPGKTFIGHMFGNPVVFNASRETFLEIQREAMRDNIDGLTELLFPKPKPGIFSRLWKKVRND